MFVYVEEDRVAFKNKKDHVADRVEAFSQHLLSTESMGNGGLGSGVVLWEYHPELASRCLWIGEKPDCLMQDMHVFLLTTEF